MALSCSSTAFRSSNDATASHFYSFADKLEQSTKKKGYVEYKTANCYKTILPATILDILFINRLQSILSTLIL